MLNLEEKVPTGEMAVCLGVLHHLNDKRKFLRRVYRNFRYAVFSEPIKSFWSFSCFGKVNLEIPMSHLTIRILLLLLVKFGGLDYNGSRYEEEE